MKVYERDLVYNSGSMIIIIKSGLFLCKRNNGFEHCKTCTQHSCKVFHANAITIFILIIISASVSFLPSNQTTCILHSVQHAT